MLIIPMIFPRVSPRFAHGLGVGHDPNETRSEFFTQLALGLHKDRLIDRLVRHPPLWLPGMILRNR